ncbi:MAG: PadR family transcriptional regulator, partial [Longimicrobiales bacterium]
EVENAISHFWKESFGSIYPVLEQLDREELISEAAAEDDPRGRRVYSLTRKGRRALADWLAAPLEPDAARNELLLKFYVGSDAAPDILIAQVESYRTRNEGFLELLNEAEKELTAALKEHAGDRRLIYRQLTVRMGKRVASARVRWANEALEVLGEAT